MQAVSRKSSGGERFFRAVEPWPEGDSQAELERRSLKKKLEAGCEERVREGEKEKEDRI